MIKLGHVESPLQYGWCCKSVRSVCAFSCKEQTELAHEMPLTWFVIAHLFDVNMDSITFAEQRQPPGTKA